jgi:cytochrome d ubiquinol oxidase subunit I
MGNGQTFEFKFPWVLGIIATRSFDTPVAGMTELVKVAQQRIGSGLVAYKALAAIKANPADQQARATFAQTSGDLGYALLLKKYRDDIENATPDQIASAALDTVPDSWTLFWSFRIMVAAGFFFIAFFAFWFVKASRNTLERHRWALWTAAIALPLPWLSVEVGWLVAEYGRQPWVVEGVLPTFYAASGLSAWDLGISLTFFVLLYSVLAVIMVWLMVRIIKAGPSSKPVLGDEVFPPEPELPQPLPAE